MNAWRFFYKVKSGNYPALVLMLFGTFLLSAIGSARYGLSLIVCGGLVFLSQHPLRLNQMLQEFYPIRWWIFTSFGVLVMACVSLIFCFDVGQTSKAIVKFLLLPMLLTCLFYFVFKHLKQGEAEFAFIGAAGIFFLHSIATIGVHLWTGDSRSVGIGDQSIIPYAIFLLFSLSIALAMLIYTPYKFLSLCLIAISLFALYANGTRASILSVAAMILCAVFYPKYPYKKLSIALTLCAFVGGGAVLLEWSEKQNARFNFKAMIEKVGIVWSYAPAEMGRFDEVCFDRNSFYRCSIYSGDRLDSRFSFESSALYRLSLSKSAIEAIKKQKFIPHGYFARFYDFNLPNNFSPKALPYLQNYGDLRFYSHIHNGFLSAFYELGIIGGVFYLFTFVTLLIMGIKRKNFQNFILSLSILGVIVQLFLDVSLSYFAIVATYSFLIGILLGMDQNEIWRLMIRRANEDHF